MMNRMVKKDFAQEIAAVIRTAKNGDRLPELLKHYHWRDVAKAITLLADAERERLFRQMDAQTLAEIFPYLDDASRYLAELPAALAAEMIADMDTADALDMLRELPEEKKQTLAAHLDDDTRKDVRRLLAFHQEEIGSRMSGNFVCIPDTLTVCGAMNELVRQAGEHDNISTLYVVDGSGVFAGAIDLKDLIIARENDPLSGIIRRSYPYVLAHERVEDCIDRIAEYEEDSLPVLTEDGRIAGILTAQDLVELVDAAQWFVTRLNTNGRLLTPALCQKLYDASLDSVQVTLYSHDKDIHNALVGADGFDDTVAGIRAAVAAGLSVSVNTPLCSLNTAYDEMLRFVHGLGVRYVTCSGLIPSGGAVGDESRATALTEQQLTDVLTKAVAVTEELEMELDFTSPGWLKEETLRAMGLTLVPSCGACLSNMAIAPDGGVIPCQSWLSSQPLGNILADDWDKIWQSERCAAIRAKSAKMEQLCQLRESNREEGTLC